MMTHPAAKRTGSTGNLICSKLLKIVDSAYSVHLAGFHDTASEQHVAKRFARVVRTERPISPLTCGDVNKLVVQEYILSDESPIRSIIRKARAQRAVKETRALRGPFGLARFTTGLLEGVVRAFGVHSISPRDALFGVLAILLL